MRIHPDGGKGTGVEAYGSNFPFVQPGPDIRGLLADLWLSHEYRAVVLPLRIAEMTGFQQAFDGLASGATIKIVDAKDATVFNSPGADYHWKPWGARLRIHEWTFSNAVCRVVQHCALSELPPPAPPPPWPDTIVPVNGVLDERTSELMPLRLLKLSEPGGVTALGKIEFHNGFNVEIKTAPFVEPLRHTTVLTFSADPGKGLGRSPGCQNPVIPIVGINGTEPDPQGNLGLAADKCYFVRQPLTTSEDGLAVPVPFTLEVGNDCDPCCDCDDFVNVQKAILNIEKGLRDTAKIAEATRDQFTVNKDRWNAQKDCREQQAVSITVGTAERVFADINAMLCNVTSHCMIDMQMDVKVETDPPAHWSVIPSTVYISEAGQANMLPYALTQDALTVTGFFGAINPMSTGRLRFRIAWDSQRPPGTAVTITAKATAPDSRNTLFPQETTQTTVMV